MGAGTMLCFPDVCLTPSVPAPIPMPYPNTAISSSTAPAAYTVLTACTPTLNSMSMGLVSLGNQTGLLLGVASHMISGQTSYTVGCFTIFMGGAPAQRLGSVTGQNCMSKVSNGVGACIAPSQATVLTLG